MNIPGTLKHKPVICLNDYDSVDGKYAADSDAKGLSLGLAQWNDLGDTSISAKVWRHNGEQWLRSSEELPLHRVLDLALMIAKSLKKASNSEGTPCFVLRKEKDALVFNVKDKNIKLELEKCVDNPELDEHMRSFNEVLEKESDTIHKRLKMLFEALSGLAWDID